jgi:DNA replication protein DnaC
MMQVHAWESQPGAGLLIFGLVGRGKTHLAVAIARHLLEAMTDVEFRRCAQFYADLREAYRTNASEKLVLAPLENAGVLVLDDLAAGSLSDHERRFTLEVLDTRLNHHRPTIVTTNWSLREIAEKLDDRIASRLGAFTTIELGGRDWRIGPSDPTIPKHPA